MKNIQIKQELFIKLIQYFYSEEIGYDNEELFDLEREIKSELQKKLDKVSMRSYYTAYKTAPTEQERLTILQQTPAGCRQRMGEAVMIDYTIFPPDFHAVKNHKKAGGRFSCRRSAACSLSLWNKPSGRRSA